MLLVYTLTLGASLSLDLSGRLLALAGAHRGPTLDAIFAVVTALMAGAGVVAWLQWRETLREMRRRLEAERATRRSEQTLTAIFDHSPAAVLVLDAASGRILRANAAFGRETGRRVEPLLGRSLDETAIFSPAFGQAVLGGGELNIRNAEQEILSATGATRTVVCSAQRVRTFDRDSVLLTLEDVTERKALEAQLAHRALHDSLTGLPNRALFNDRLEHAIRQGGRRRSAPALLYIDLDDFKLVNDRLGHAIGDALLKAVADRLRECLRTSDTCARLGGDEFAVLAEQADVHSATRLSERILHALRTPLQLGDVQFPVTVSIGIAVAEPGQSADVLVRNADLALYIAKGEGKGRAAMFEPEQHGAALRRRQLEGDLMHGLRCGEFSVHYQPIATIPGGTLTAVEALVRWRHARYGDIGPNEFIPIAEMTGAIIPLGRWVLEQACRQFARWHRDCPAEAPASLAVNLSGRQIADPGLVGEVAAVLDDTGVAPSQLVLEITESVLVGHDERDTKTLWRLRDLGVRIAIDDFGTGYSSLAYLQRFPVDILKIDKSFTARLGVGVDESPISLAIFGLGRTLEIETIAEGIETAEQWSRLEQLGCELGQGYLLARPMPAARFREFLAERRELAGRAARG